MVWSIVKKIGSNGQMLGLQDQMTYRIFSKARLKNCARE